ECPSRDAVLAEVQRVLGSSRGIDADMARADVSRDGVQGWHASLRVEARGATTKREFDAESCSAIAAATAVILAVVTEDSAGEAARAPEPPPPPPPSPESSEGSLPSLLSSPPSALASVTRADDPRAPPADSPQNQGPAELPIFVAGGVA